MLDVAKTRAASDILVGHWDAGTRLDALPADCRPASRAEGYAVQAHLMARTAAPLYGWKIAATSVAGQRHINVDGPLAGRILAEKVFREDDVIPLDKSLMKLAEIEFAFRMARDLPPRAEAYGVDEVMDAVAALHPSIELPDTRYADCCAVGAAQLIADNACGDRFILGAASPEGWRGADLAALEVEAEVVGKSHHPGVGRNVLGDPRVALAWLVNELSGLGITLHAGEVVTTGTCVVPIPVVAGDEVRATFGPWGTVSARFG